MTTCQKCNGFVGFVDGPHELKPCLCDFKSFNQTHPMNTTTQCKRTPGPWTIDADGDGKPDAIITSTHDRDGPDDDICEVYGGNADDDETRHANARLIAAAPELLEELQHIAELIGKDGGTVRIGPMTTEAIHKAIAKATGVQS